ncbi:expressed unknown protein [Seminavis robusta]|uniref:Uncharacterized protein n=1 Tax=Seminavis robusta TaxID=568900 RepID=A0A9N8EXV8_9STRA|nr:expressed unknown protein [Seminavis robusta]|eukprot:Sro2115_g315170.1 n/a (546) ;mRNA; r:15099-16736
MGCCTSSPHAKRRYLDPADLVEEFVDILPDNTSTGPRLRTFGRYRPNQVFVPDDIDGLPSSKLNHKLATSPNTVLYTAEIDNGKSWDFLRPCLLIIPLWPWVALQWWLANGCEIHCDLICCWVRKEYSTRTYYRVYANRIEVNDPRVRFPFGVLGCGSWTADHVLSHPFDRGAFGFHRVRFGVPSLLCCVYPTSGDVVARQRCQCNGPFWYSCDGWWCDEWLCDMMCCTFRYNGLADGDETAFASNLALQAYYEGRHITPTQMEQCLDYWRNHISEMGDPIHRQRPVLCEESGCSMRSCIPTGKIYQRICQCERRVPEHFERTPEIVEVYDKYETLRRRQTDRYLTFKEPVYHSTVCRSLGCRRCFGRKGVIFCTEGCCCENKDHTMGRCYKHLPKDQVDDPFAPYIHTDWDDDNSAAKVLQIVLGNPPRNVVYRKWQFDPDTKQYTVVESPTITNNETVSTPKTASNGHCHHDESKEHPGEVAVLSNHHHQQQQIVSPDGYEVFADESLAMNNSDGSLRDHSSRTPHIVATPPGRACTILTGEF